MRFGGEVHHGRRLVLLEDPLDRVAVGHVALHENVVRVAQHGFQRIEIAGVGELIEVDDPRRCVGRSIAARSNCR